MLLSNVLSWIGAHWAQIISLLQLIVTFWIAFVARSALRTWKKQLRAEKQLSFIDDLTDTVHEFIQLMAAPIQHLVVAKICIEAHKGAASGFEQYENAEMIAFINKDGQGTSDRFAADLARVTPVFAKMQSLAVKGQVLGLQDYSECLNAWEMLAWSHGQLQAFCAIIGNPNLNWNNPQVQESLNNISKIDADRIKTNLEDQNRKFLEFAKKAREKVL